MSEHDELLQLAELGRKFREQQRKGRKPGALANLILDCTRYTGPSCSFERLLTELGYRAQRRAVLGLGTEVVEVDHSGETVVLNLPRRGLVDVPFGTIRNHLTRAKKRLLAEIPASG